MSSRGNEFKRLAKVIKPYGLSIVTGRKHKHITNNKGQAVWHMSSSPSCPYFAVNTLSDLKKLGLVPKDVRL